MAVEGEEFAVGVAMVLRYLSIVSIKDVLLTRAEKDGHGAKAVKWVPAGQGVVDWSVVFPELKRVGYAGPLSIHCEFEVEPAQFADTFAREVRFFKQAAAQV
jgi:sugar phosphate isomerase/epimerase